MIKFYTGDDIIYKIGLSCLSAGISRASLPVLKQVSLRYRAKITAILVIMLSFVILSPGKSLCAQDEEHSVRKSKHFIVYYSEVPTAYASKVTRSAEHYYKSIINYLGFNRFNFWTWEKRCKVYLYPTQERYQEATDAEPWSTGRVHVTKKEISTYAGKEEFLDYTLPHEMGHIIFREAIGTDKSLPLWIDEGVATLQEKDREKYLLTAKMLVKEKNFIPLSELSSIRGYDEISPALFYSESASIMEFLIEKFGKRKFVLFCHRLRDGEGWQEALLRTYKFENLEALERAWVESVTG